MESGGLSPALAFAIESAQLAGTLTLGYFEAATPHEAKADGSPVTAADRGAEKLLRARIEQYFPDHGILGEEFGEKPARSPARWILDPIDGTFSFIHGVPLYAVLVAMEWAGEAVLGVIHLPALRETVWAARGLGCWWNGRRARVSQTGELSQATLLTGGGKTFDSTGRTAEFERLRRACHNHRSWCDAYAYALVATGRAEVVLDPKMEVWDTAALVPVIQEAGGRLTDWRDRVTHTGGDVVATNGRLHPAVMSLLRTGQT